LKAIVVQGENQNPVLVWEDVDDIEYGPEEVLVDVQATAVNRADLSQARGNYRPPPGASEILGLEMAGVIREVGTEVSGWKAGDRVCALLSGGGYAEQAAVHHQMLLRLPDDWSFAQGAAVPEVWYTAFVNLFLEGNLQPGETVLIHAGASGVGTAAIQLAVAIGARAFVTAGSDEKLARCRALGAALAVNYKTEDFLEKVLAATKNEGVHLILDPVGGPYLARNVQTLRLFGRLINIGTLGGGQGELNMGLVLGKQLRIIGSLLRPRPLAEKIAITRHFEQRFWPRLTCNELRPVIDRVFPIAEAQAAHEYVLQNKNIGKVILTIDN
jgi:putative PIG3 family NAD(P)H quinone oxidoreductase